MFGFFRAYLLQHYLKEAFFPSWTVYMFTMALTKYHTLTTRSERGWGKAILFNTLYVRLSNSERICHKYILKKYSSYKIISYDMDYKQWIHQNLMNSPESNEEVAAFSRWERQTEAAVFCLHIPLGFHLCSAALTCTLGLQWDPALCIVTYIKSINLENKQQFSIP